MAHGDDEHDGKHETEDDGTKEVTPRHYWEHKPSRRARPQYDPAEIARAYLDDMEKGGRLHLQRKKQ